MTDSRRILLTICDGAPHDGATLAANSPDYLERHFRSVIQRIKKSPVQPGAIGIGLPVGRFYGLDTSRLMKFKKTKFEIRKKFKIQMSE